MEHPGENTCLDLAQNSTESAARSRAAVWWLRGECSLRVAIMWGWMGSPYPIQIAGGPCHGLLPSEGLAVTHACHKHISRWIMNPGCHSLRGKLWIFFAVLPPSHSSSHPGSPAPTKDRFLMLSEASALRPFFQPVMVCFVGCVG